MLMVTLWSAITFILCILFYCETHDNTCEKWWEEKKKSIALKRDQQEEEHAYYDYWH